MNPRDCKYSKEHEWVRLEGGLAAVGISDYAQDRLGDIVYVELPPLGEILTLEDVDLRGATVLVRVDINSPINPTDGTFLDITRFERSLPTLRELADSKVVVLAHQSRPGKADYTTLREHTRVLGRLLGRPSTYVDDLIGTKASRAIRTMEVGELLVLENTRLFAEETTLSKTSLETQSRTAESDDAANYNYNENLLLTQAIQKGARGAYWDILRQLRSC